MGQLDGQLDEHMMDECENRRVETMRDELMMDVWENRCVDKWEDRCVDGHLDAYNG